jgi:hypothetical protein
VREALVGVAAAVVSASGAAWWSTPLERASQSRVVFEDAASPVSPAVAPARERLARWRSGVEQEEIVARRERPVDPRAPWSGTWWSTPPADLLRITRDLGGWGPVGLSAVEDSFGWERASAHPVIVPDGVRVYEIDGPEAWVQLCRHFPLEVTASRRHDWYRATGRAGRWVIPDWARAAEEVDAVHLTVNGYLHAAGRAIPVSPGICSVLAGWNPDETYWLTDAVPTTGAGRAWVRGHDHTWREDAP